MYSSLHIHSDFSNVRLLDSINKIEPLIKYANELKLKGIALTDHECISGWIDLLNTTKKLKEKGKISPEFKTILGNEIYLINSRDEARDIKIKTKFYTDQKISGEKSRKEYFNHAPFTSGGGD